MDDSAFKLSETEKGDFVVVDGPDTQFTVFFGNRFAHLDYCRSLYSNKIIKSLQQVHSNEFIIVDQPELASGNARADALVTANSNIALMVYTADCLPVIIVDPVENKIAAIHAGWRGLFNGICKNVIQHSLFGSTKNLRAFVGPHIQSLSFEIQPNIFDKIEPAIANLSGKKSDIILSVENRHYINMAKYLELELNDCGLSSSQLSISDIDTFSSQQHHSFRRDHSHSGRQYTLVGFNQH